MLLKVVGSFLNPILISRKDGGEGGREGGRGPDQGCGGCY